MKKLFCLPYAGGSSIMYGRMRTLMKDKYEVIPIEYPGHGYRLNEKLLSELDIIIDDIYRFIKDRVGGYDYSLLGYSLGGVLAYWTAKKISDNQEISSKLKSVVICSCVAPSCSEPPLRNSFMSDDDFIKYLIRLGGTRISTEEDERALRFFLPIVRSDFDLYEKCKIVNTDDSCLFQLNVPMAIFYSKDEKEVIKEWSQYSSDIVTYKQFPGGHFFINNEYERLAKEVINFIDKVS